MACIWSLSATMVPSVRRIGDQAEKAAAAYGDTLQSELLLLCVVDTSISLLLKGWAGWLAGWLAGACASSARSSPV